VEIPGTKMSDPLKRIVWYLPIALVGALTRCAPTKMPLLSLACYQGNVMTVKNWMRLSRTSSSDIQSAVIEIDKSAFGYCVTIRKFRVCTA
jgi:hypothetical protein